MFVLLVRWQVAAADHTAMRDLLVKQAANSLSLEPGCRHFDVAERAEAPGQFVLYEIYADQAALEAHRQTPHFAAFTAAAAAMTIDKQVETWRLCA